MNITQRYEISREVEDWFDTMDKKLIAAGESEILMGRDIFSVVQALDILGYIHKSECRGCEHYNGLKADCAAPSFTPCNLK